MRQNYLIFAFLLIFPALFNSQNKVSESELVKKAAIRDIPAFTKLIPEGHEKEYGFNNRAEFSEISMGEPYQVFTFYQSAKENKVIPLKSWRVPVVVKNHFVALLTVEMSEAGYKGLDFGAMELASWMEIFEKSQEMKPTRVLMRSFKGQKDFFATVNTVNDINEKSDVYAAKSLKKLSLAEVFSEINTN